MNISSEGKSAPKVVWTFDARGKITSLIADPVFVCSGSGLGSLDVLDARNGGRIWSKDVAYTVWSLVAIDDFLVVFAFSSSQGGAVYTFDRKTGREEWIVSVEGVGSLAGGSGVVYVGTDGSIFAFDVANGTKIWTADIIGTAHTLVYHNGTLFANTCDVGRDAAGYVYAFDAATGKRKWNSDEHYWLGSMLICPPLVLVSCSDDVIALRADRGQATWRFSAEWTIQGLTWFKDNIHVASSDKNIYALEMITGEERWRFRCGGAPVALTVGLGLVLACSQDGSVYALDAVTGNRQYR